MIPNSLLSANAIPISRSEKLRLTFYSPTVGVSNTIAIRYQIADANGTISNNYDTFLLASEANGTDRVLPLTDGLLIAVTVTSTSTGLQAGELYCTMALQYGDVEADSNLLQLLAGYLASNSPLNYPLTESRAINQTEPASITDTFNDPASGNEFQLVFPQLFYTRLTNFSFQLVTDGTIGDRTIKLKISDAHGDVFYANASPNVPDSSTHTFFPTSASIPPSIPSNTHYFYIPSLPFLRGLIIESQTTNIGGGDQYTNFFFRSEKYVAT